MPSDQNSRGHAIVLRSVPIPGPAPIPLLCKHVLSPTHKLPHSIYDRPSEMAARHQRQSLRNHPNLQRFLIANARPTGRQLGAGSYGSVEELEVNGIVCAGKKIHETLIEQGNFGAENIASKYVEECHTPTWSSS